MDSLPDRFGQDSVVLLFAEVPKKESEMEHGVSMIDSGCSKSWARADLNAHHPGHATGPRMSLLG